jgi:polysaccharide biosynthesis protein PslL
MNRQDWIDIAKGLGILCVAAGHVWSGGPAYDAIYLFHMPLFFFLSGYLFYPRSDRLGYLGRKSFHLLVPYFAFLILLFLPRFFHAALAVGSHPNILLDTLSTMLYGGQMLKGTSGIFWFVTCLFLTQQTANLVLSTPLRKAAPVIFAVFLVLAYVNQFMFPRWHLPWDANVVLFSAPVFYVGYLLRGRALGRTVAILACVLAVAGLGAVMLGAPWTMDLKNGKYGIPLLSLSAALCCILALMQLSKGMERFSILRAPLGILGRASMTIMFLHLPALVLFQDYFHWENPWLLFPIIVALPLAADWLFHRFAWTRVIFLGDIDNWPKPQPKPQELQEIKI